MADELNQEKELQNIANVITTFDAKSYIDKIITSIKSGNINPLSAFTIVKRMAKVSEEILKDKEVKKLAIDEANKYLGGNQKTFQLHGATISKAATYTWYDFSECNHPVLDELYKIQNEVKDRIKLLEDELKLLIVPETKQATLGVGMDTKSIVVESIPFLKWEQTEDQVVVHAPKKNQDIGLKYMKI